MAKSLTTQRSLKYLSDNGYIADVVERYNSFTRRKHDMFNVFDIVAMSPQKGEIVGVQTTTASNLSSRIKKILDSEDAYDWLRSGGKIEVHGWKQNKKSRRWSATVRRLTTSDFSNQFILRPTK